jgi:hypothetical protein
MDSAVYLQEIFLAVSSLMGVVERRFNILIIQTVQYREIAHKALVVVWENTFHA